MDVREFLASDWIGRGVVRGVTGRTLRSFTVTYRGVWAAEHQAFHIDEQVAYADGRAQTRAWAVSPGERDTWVGADDSGGRMIVRPSGDVLLVDFDRSRVVRGFNVAKLSLRRRPDGPDRRDGRGVTRVLGLPLTLTEEVYSRAPAPRAGTSGAGTPRPGASW